MIHIEINDEEKAQFLEILRALFRDEYRYIFWEEMNYISFAGDNDEEVLWLHWLELVFGEMTRRLFPKADYQFKMNWLLETCIIQRKETVVKYLYREYCRIYNL
jgi:hypothetical protein